MVTKLNFSWTKINLQRKCVNEPEENDVAEDVVLVSIHLVRPVRGLVRQVLVDQTSAHKVAQQVAEGCPGRGAEADLYHINTREISLIAKFRKKLLILVFYP